jgi:hypothetical protein
VSFFGLKYRHVGIFLAMSRDASDRVKDPQRGNNMGLLLFQGVFVAWIMLQAWVLPRVGVKA